MQGIDQELNFHTFLEEKFYNGKFYHGKNILVSLREERT